MDLKMSDYSIYVGRIYASKPDLYKSLSLYAMKRLFSFRITKSDAGRVIANCVDRNCTWRVYAVAHKDSENFEVRTVQLKYSCAIAARSCYAEEATSKILGELLQPKFANGKKGPRACDIPELILAEHRVVISYTKAWNAKELVLASARGNDEESFRFLLTYLHLLRTTNPGTITYMVTGKDRKGNTQFKYFFFALGASIAGCKYLKKVIVIDGTQMKGKYKGYLVAASCKDGNKQIFPLVFGVVDGENEASWAWLFKNLKKIVADDSDLVFVSDRHAAIYSAIKKVFPIAHHVTYTLHLCCNVVQRFKNEGLAAVVSKAAHAYTTWDFRYWWAEIERRNPSCGHYLLNMGLLHWTLSHFPGMKYNIMTSNICESLNSAMKKAVDYPIASVVEFLRTMLMRWFCTHREKSGNAKSRCTPDIEGMWLKTMMSIPLVRC